MLKKFVLLLMITLAPLALLGTGVLAEGSGNAVISTAILDEPRTVSLGYEFSGAVTRDGSLYMWGSNDFGQLGDGTENSKAKPTKVMDNVSAVVAGFNATAAIKTDNSLWMCGYGLDGALGTGDGESSKTFIKVMDGVKQVDLSGDHTLALRQDGSVWAFGSNYNGELGNGSTEQSNSPIKVMDGVVKIGTPGDSPFSVALKGDGSLMFWGAYYVSRNGDLERQIHSTPIRIAQNVANFSVDEYDSIYYLTTSGDLRRTDIKSLNSSESLNEDDNQKGLGNDLPSITQLCLEDAGPCFALKNSSDLYAWGSTEAEELGIGNIKPTFDLYEYSNAVKVLENVSAVSTQFDHSAAILKDGSLALWGSNSKGEIGDGLNVSRSRPAIVLKNVGLSANSIGGGTHIKPSSDMSLVHATVTLPQARYKYSGDRIRPEVTVKVGNKTLTKDENYTLYYRGNLNIGTGRAIIRGKNGYRGVKTVTFEIVK